MDFLLNLLQPLMWAESWVMMGWYRFAGLFGIQGGWAWAIAIAGLTVVVRLLLIPLFVKQIHASRQMQLIQPELAKIQAKYKNKKDPESRQAMTQETMEFYKKTGTNPFSSCMPILLQMPFFFALFQLLNNLKGIAEGRLERFADGIGPITRQVAVEFENSYLFGSKLSDSFMFSHSTETKILTAVLIVLMSVTTFTTQHQLMRKNMPKSALESPYARQQKIIIYVMPFFFALSGINFPIGVLIYWLTTNLWTMGQQFYVIRRMPAPGSAAEKALHERQARRGKSVTPLTLPGLSDADDQIDDVPAPSRQRQQPMSKKRAKAAGVRAANELGSGSETDRPAGEVDAIDTSNDDAVLGGASGTNPGPSTTPSKTGEAAGGSPARPGGTRPAHPGNRPRGGQRKPTPRQGKKRR